MTKAKKAIGVILAVVMLATMFAFGSFAAAAGNATFTVTPSATQVEVGDTVTVTVAVTTDYYAGPIGVPVHYDAALFDYVEGSFTPNADIYGAGAADANAFNNNGCLTVAFAPKSEVAGVKAQVLNNVTLFTFQLTAKANGVSPVQLKAEDQKALGNMTGKLYCGQKANAAITSEDIMIGQTFTLNNSSVTIGSQVTEPNTLEVKADFEFASDVIIDKDVVAVYMDWYGGDYADAEDANFTGLVYGVEVFDYLLDENVLTTSLGDEYLRVTRTEAAGDYDSTGTLIEVLGADGVTVVETYYFVYFGDLNCDGVIDPSDVTDCADCVNNGTIFASIAQYIAADYNGDTFVDPSDISDLVQSVNEGATANQGELAATFYAEYQAQL